MLYFNAKVHVHVCEQTLLTLGAHAPEGCSTCPICLYVCLSVGANLRTGTGRHLTKGTSGLSSTFSQNYKGVFSRDQASSSPPFCSCCDVSYALHFTSVQQVQLWSCACMYKTMVQYVDMRMCIDHTTCKPRQDTRPN